MPDARRVTTAQYDGGRMGEAAFDPPNTGCPRGYNRRSQGPHASALANANGHDFAATPGIRPARVDPRHCPDDWVCPLDEMHWIAQHLPPIGT